jgi:glycosyltransferase involved in cell wall biosynthesis
MPPEVSVVIATRDRPQYLDRALRSLVLQSLDDFEVILVNDGGADVSAVTAGYAGRLVIRTLRFPDNRGPSAARNAAAEIARGSYLAFLDDDDVFLPDHLARAVEPLRAGTADFVYTTALVSRVPIEPAADLDPGELAAAAPAAFDYEFDHEFLRVLNYVPPVAVVCRDWSGTAAVFPEERRVGEDWDFWLMLIRDHGYRAVHVDAPTAVYHRLPRHTASSDPVGDASRMLKVFHESYQDMCEKRWPEPDGTAIAQARAHVLRAYDAAFHRLDSGKPLPDLWYEQLVRLLYHSYTQAGRSERHTTDIARDVRAIFD